MPETENKQSLFSYLDKALGEDGIKTTSKFDVSIDKETAVTLAAIGVGLIIFNQVLSIGVRAVMKS